MKVKCSFILAALATVCLASSAFALSDREYSQKVRRLRAQGIFTTQDLQRARSKAPAGAFELVGQVSGILACSSQTVLMIKLADGDSVEVKTAAVSNEIQPGVRVRCLVRSAAKNGLGPLSFVAAVIDVGQPLAGRRGAASGRGEVVYAPQPLPSRGIDNDVLFTCKRAIAYFNPRLSVREVNQIATNIVGYSNYVGIDPYFIVAVVATESRFNPNARSYKGAMGLGQLMPGTARGMGVRDPYDPVDNLAGAIRLLRNHLLKYQNQPYQVALALAAYNAGSGAVKRHGGVPPYRETYNYIWKVYEYYCWMHGVQPEPRPRR